MALKVPGPRGRLFVGQLPEYEADRLGWLVRTRAEFGDVVRLAPNAVVVHDLELARRVLGGTNDDYLLDSAQLAGRRQQNALRRRVPEWMRLRRLVSRACRAYLTPRGVEHLVRVHDKVWGARTPHPRPELR